MAAAAPKVPRVGVGVFVLNDKDEFIIGLRKGSHGAGTWALPGGHLEFGEDFETCAAREILEETGLSINRVEYLTATNDVMAAEGKHYITVFVTARLSGTSKEPAVLEPDKCERWQWQAWSELRRQAEGVRGADGVSADGTRLFLPLVNLVRQRPGVRPGSKAA